MKTNKISLYLSVYCLMILREAVKVFRKNTDGDVKNIFIIKNKNLSKRLDKNLRKSHAMINK